MSSQHQQHIAQVECLTQPTNFAPAEQANGIARLGQPDGPVGLTGGQISIQQGEPANGGLPVASSQHHRLVEPLSEPGVITNASDQSGLTARSLRRGVRPTLV
ncbi:hypothetical protein PTTG_28994 [Puccinia triticina 1-1 BBBD Race 1]|uniref:Uncharacterized protein n=1 Tax=Puccinia triticina (isolate 1-1 / race 1 (BBBD)) TaxID=630390 RepID=A0A180G9H3_PUCT1|nr:hypothetical protein PTTG_28994 [Puccinia triticina 1-1 BBBD Race 1]